MFIHVEQRPLAVRIGDVFTTNPATQFGRGSNRVVVDLDDIYSYGCISTGAYLTRDGKEALALAGRSTTVRSDIKAIVGHWDPDKVLEALKAGYFDIGMERLWEKRRDLLMEVLNKPPIFLGRSVPLL